MSQEHVEALRAVYDEWGNGNFRAGVDLYDPDVVFVQGAGFPESGAYHGREGIREYMRTFLETWTRLCIGADELLEAGDTVVVEVVQRGAGRAKRGTRRVPLLPCVVLPRAQGDSPRRDQGPGGRPRSRRAFGVGDVAGERGGRSEVRSGVRQE